MTLCPSLLILHEILIQMLKRIFDVTVASVIFVFFLPVFVIIAIQVHRKLNSPIFFRQIRPGKDGLPFELIKFRTMKDIVDTDGKTLKDCDRMTTFGELLRSTSLDELPELWNVIKGDMSLVGPRPLLMEYLPLYDDEQKRRHELRPGITGWAQVNGRNAVSWEKRFAMDVWYVDNQSFWLDLKIICMTVIKVFLREGITEEGEVSMTKFTGSKK